MKKVRHNTKIIMKQFYPTLIKSLFKKRDLSDINYTQPKVTVTNEKCSQNDNKNASIVDSKQILEDLMESQLKMAQAYNYCAMSCSSEAIRNDLLNIIKDNYDVYNKEYTEAKKRGWLNEIKATTENIDTVKAKYSSEELN